ncbi:mitochondrial acidic protein Mam33p [[Candida] anglica]|uniref:Mitochondrial acidic protein Mam33p n=1 Tax=[Candida] anglica TaxID=148631 RepID=A0ABP0EQR5_9ASCO
MSSRLFSSAVLRQCAKTMVARPSFTLRAIAPVMSSPSRVMGARFMSTEPIAAELRKVLNTELHDAAEIGNELDPEYKAYIKDSGFKLNQVEGGVTVQLTKSTGPNEVVHVFFDADDVTNVPAEAAEEGLNEESAYEDEMEAIDEMMCAARVVIENTENNTALFVNLFLEPEAGLVVDHFNTQPNATEFLKNAAEGKFTDVVSYSGPSFSMLDESLQITFEEYLNSKGINKDLSEFITAYSEFKEEQEYRKWLKDVSTFFA